MTAVNVYPSVHVMFNNSGGGGGGARDISTQRRCGGKNCNWKVMVKVKFILEQATKAQKGSRGIALPFNLGADRSGW